MPQRKYQDLAHLNPDEYRKEAEKRRCANRKEYNHNRYMEKEGLIKAENKKKRLEEKLASILEKLEKVEKVEKKEEGRRGASPEKSFAAQ
jgi:hypothetical protein